MTPSRSCARTLHTDRESTQMEPSSQGATLKGAPRQPLDRALSWVAAVLLVAVFGAGAYLTYSVMQARAIEQGATPSARLIADLRDQVEASPNDADLRVRLGEALAAAGRYPEAVKELETALQLDEEHTGAHLLLGIVAMVQKEYTGADGFFLKVVDLTEGTDFQNVKLHRELAYYYLGESALDTGRYDEAIGYFKAALRINRSAANTYFGLAMALKGIDDTVGALENLEIALAFDPKFAQAHYEMGQLYLAEDDRVNAAVHFAEAALLAPENELALEALSSLGTAEEWETRARDAVAVSDNDAALEASLIARALDQDDASLVVLHAEVLEAMGEADAALEVYSEALGLAPDDENIQAAIARLQEQ